MSKKIVQLPHVKKANSIIERFNERLDFSDFLKVIDLVIEGKYPTKEAFALFENAKTKGLLPFSKWDSLFQCLARIDFTQSIVRQQNVPPEHDQEISPDNNESSQPTKSVDAEFQQQLENIKASLRELAKQHEQLKKYQENPYFVFYPALQIQNDLEAEFQGANPGQVIGGYLRAFFGDVQPHEEFRPAFACTADTQLRALVAAIIMWKMETSNQVKNEDDLVISDGRAGDIKLMDFDSLCFGLWFGADVSPDSCLMQIMADAPKLSQSLFESLLWHWLALCEKKHVKSTAVDLFIMHLPIGDSHSLYDLPKDVYGFTEEGECNARFSEKFWGASVDLGKIPFIPWQILCKLVDKRPIISIRYSDPEEEESRAAETNFRHYADCKMNWDVGRHRRLFGCSPLDTDDLQNLWIGYSHENADLLVLLSHTASLMNDYPFGLNFLVDDEIDENSTQNKSYSFRRQFEKKAKVQKEYKKNNQARHLQTRAKYYLQLIKQAKNEGYDELATNALSFFLFSQAGTTGKLLVPINELSPLIEQFLSLPGKEMLRHAITFASGLIRESGEITSALVLNSWVSQRQPDLKIIDPTARRPYFVPVDIARQTVSNQLLENLGSERVSRFSEEAFQLLVEAEIQWSNNYHEFGRGLIKDWGTFGLAFVKPIELELVRRIGAASKSDSYSAFLKARGNPPISKPTLGPLIYMLKDFNQLPSDVQDSIKNSGVKLHENSDLIKDLININNLRIKGAHPAPFSEKDYLRLRTTLFGDGGLKLFLDLLSDVA